MENNWRQKSLENLEKDKWPELSQMESSNLVKTCYSLRKKTIQDFSIEDLRIMIQQGIGLYYLIPTAIEVLKTDLFAEGNMFKGDLLKAVLNIETKFWNDNRNYWHQLNEIVKHKRPEILKMKFDISKFDISI